MSNDPKTSPEPEEVQKDNWVTPWRPKSRRKSPAVLRAEAALAVAEKELADFEEQKAQLLPPAQAELERAKSALEDARRKEGEVVGEARKRLGLERPDVPTHELVDELLRWAGVALDEKDLFMDSPRGRSAVERAARNTASRILYADAQVAQAMALATRAQEDFNAAQTHVRVVSDAHRLLDRVCGRRDAVEHARHWSGLDSRLSIPVAMEEAHDKAVEKLLGVTDPYRHGNSDADPAISWPPASAAKSDT